MLRGCFAGINAADEILDVRCPSSLSLGFVVGNLVLLRVAEKRRMEEGKELGAYVGWEEVVVSSERGRREVYYYLKRAEGNADLAVVGREKSVRHMSYAAQPLFLDNLRAQPSYAFAAASASYAASPSCSPSGGGLSLRWRSRREVIDWLSALVEGSHTSGSSPMVDAFSDDEDVDPDDVPASKDLSSGKMAYLSKEFSWLGSAWKCRKRRKHYPSFCRNGITISEHAFVSIMAEENKRLVAYVEDLYEDMRGNKMVVVRWFHKVDEVGIVLPPDVCDREIFFSPCLQDFSVECIDGLAAVLNAQHFEKFQNEGTHGTWEPYLCRRQIDNDDVKPFDITQVQGYWNQQLLRSMYLSSLKLRLKISYGGSSLEGDGNGQPLHNGLKINRLNGGDVSVSGTARNMNRARSIGDGSKGRRHVASTSSSPLFRKDLLKQRAHQQQLSPGCHIEVLSQDSGIRGCWFRCVVIKRHRDKMKVRYQDVRDAEETKNLEEWVLASRVAAPDKLDIRLSGRLAVRPHQSNKGRSIGCFGVGAIVDAWWHDGWWEGIVIYKTSRESIHVYFPGEQRVSVFAQDHLRHSQDWVCNKWNRIEDRPDIVSSLLPDLDLESRANLSNGFIDLQQPVPWPHASPEGKSSPPEDKVAFNLFPSGEDVVPNLVKDCMLDRLKWSSSKKRKRGRESSRAGSDHKRQCDGSSSSSRDEAEEEPSVGKQFALSKSLAVDHEHCKVGGDPLFSPPIALSSLVMSR